MGIDDLYLVVCSWKLNEEKGGKYYQLIRLVSAKSVEEAQTKFTHFFELTRKNGSIMKLEVSNIL